MAIFFVDLFKLSVSVDMSRSSVHVAAAALCLPGIIFKSGFSDITATIAELFGQLVKYILQDKIISRVIKESPLIFKS